MNTSDGAWSKKRLRPPATGSARQQYNESLRVAVSWKPLRLISTISPSLFRQPLQLLKTFALPLTRRMLTPLVMLRHWARILVTSYVSNGSIFCRSFARWTRHSPPRPHHRRQSWRDQTTFWSIAWPRELPPGIGPASGSRYMAWLRATGVYWGLSETNWGTGHKNNILTMDDSCSFRLMNTRKISS